MNRKKRLPQSKINKVLKRHCSLLQTRTKLMKSRALKMMDPIRLMMKRSDQRTTMEGQMKENGLKWILVVVIPRFCQPFQASTILFPVIPPNLDKPVRHKNLSMILKICLKLRLVAQIKHLSLRTFDCFKLTFVFAFVGGVERGDPHRAKSSKSKRDTALFSRQKQS
jgi:hypothetical protein